LLTIGNKVFITGNLQSSDSRIQLISNEIVSFEDTKATLWIRTTNVSQKTINDILSKTTQGINDIVVYDSAANKRYNLNNKISLENNLFKILERIYGIGNVKIT
jgi:arsenate reductase-like glutaredoxin family protein